MMEKLIKKAETLIEVLPYIKSFNSKTFVIKYGGAAMVDENLKRDIVHNLILLKYIGINPVIVHGGGPEITAYLNRLNKKTEFVNGLRITDRETMEIVQMVLIGKINQELVSLINLHGGKAVGLSGKDANLMFARKHANVMDFSETSQTESEVDLGYVGQIQKVDPTLLLSLCESGFIPVISPIAVGFEGESYNVNADQAASEIAQTLKAEKLIILTDVDGIYEVPENPATKVYALPVDKARQMIEHNQIKGGMIPKVNACIDAVENGVKRTHIIDGREKHSILLEIFTDKGIGTMVIGS